MSVNWRQVRFYFFIGYNRTGKSITAQTFANKWAIANPGCIIAGFDPQHRFKHLINPKYKLSSGEKGWWDGNEQRAKRGRRPLKELRNALVILDDMKGLNSADKTMADLFRLMEFRAEYSIDVICIAHSPALVLSGLSIYVSHWFIFYTKGRKAKFEDKIENYEECTFAAQIMTAYVKRYPSVMAKPEQFFDNTNQGKHRFPHIVIDTDSSQISFQNMHNQWLKEYLNNYQPSINN